MREPVKLALESDIRFGEQTAQGGENLIRPGTPFRQAETEGLELVPIPARTDAQDEAPLRERVQCLNLTGEREWMIVGEYEHARGETNSAGHARSVGQAEQRRHPRGT